MIWVSTVDLVTRMSHRRVVKLDLINNGYCLTMLVAESRISKFQENLTPNKEITGISLFIPLIAKYKLSNSMVAFVIIFIFCFRKIVFKNNKKGFSCIPKTGNTFGNIIICLVTFDNCMINWVV